MKLHNKDVFEGVTKTALFFQSWAFQVMRPPRALYSEKDNNVYSKTPSSKVRHF